MRDPRRRRGVRAIERVISTPVRLSSDVAGRGRRNVRFLSPGLHTGARSLFLLPSGSDTVHTYMQDRGLARGERERERRRIIFIFFLSPSFALPSFFFSISPLLSIALATVAVPSFSHRYDPGTELPLPPSFSVAYTHTCTRTHILSLSIYLYLPHLVRTHTFAAREPRRSGEPERRRETGGKGRRAPGAPTYPLCSWRRRNPCPDKGT